MINSSKNTFIKLENVFLLLGLIYGLLLVFLTPPFENNDETRHFFRVYQISDGQIVALKADGKAGGYLPKSLWEAIQQPHIKIKDIRTLISLPLNEAEKTYISFPQTVLYSPFPYAFQAFGTLLGRKIDASPIILMYLGRMFGLFGWLFLTYTAIKLIPCHKALFVILALAPMSLSEAATVSADGTTNAVSFLWIALILWYVFEQVRVEKKDFFLLIFLAAILSFCKSVYFPLVFLIFLIPPYKIGTPSKYIMFLILFFGISLGAFLSWSGVIKELYVPVRFGTSMNDQLQWLIHQPWSFLLVLMKTFYSQGPTFFEEWIGKLGWLSLPLPKGLIIYYGLSILFVTVCEKQCFNLSKYQKLTVLSVFLVSVSLAGLSIYLHDSEIGAQTILGLQGRYFIPVAPLALLLFGGLKPIRLKIEPFKMALFVSVTTTLTLAFTCLAILKRYYI